MIIEMPNLVGGMNTTVDPLRTGLNQASMLRNCDIKGAEVRMRKGTTSYIDSLGTGRITGMFPFTTTDGTVSQLVFGWGTKLYYVEEEDATPTEIATGLTSDSRWEVIVFDDELKFINEDDDLYGTWDGSSWSTATLTGDLNIPDSAVDISTGESRVIIITKSRLYWSKIEDPDDFTTGDSGATGIGAFGSSDGDYLTAVHYINGKFFVFKNRSIYKLVFDYEGAGGIDVISNSVGCVSRRSIAEKDGYIVFQSENGVQMLDPIGETIIQGDFAGLLSRDISTNIFDKIQHKERCAGHYYTKEGRYMLALNQGTNNSIIVNQYQREPAYPWTLYTNLRAGCFCEFEGELLYGDDVNGIIYKMEQDNREDNGNPILWEVEFTKDINQQGDERVETDKIFDAMRVEAILKVGTIVSTEISTNFHAAVTDSFSHDGASYEGVVSAPLGEGIMGHEVLGPGYFESFEENKYVHKRLPIGSSGSYVKVTLSNNIVNSYVSLLGIAFEIENLDTTFLA